ncbi:MAG: hypothetical protein ACI4D8_04560 [Wujia sp.]
MDNNNQGYSQQQAQTGYTQPVQGYQQQAQTGYTQPVQGYQQQAQGYQYQPQMQYQQQQSGQTVANLMKNAKDVKNDFTNKVKRMGLSTWCLLGIIGAMLLIFAPFMNFATIHINETYKEDGIKLRLKAADGLNMFELSKLSNTVDKDIKEYNRLVKKYDDESMDYDEFYEEIDDLDGELSSDIIYAARYGEKIDKDDIVDALDDIDELADMAEDKTDLDIGGSIKEAGGILHLVLKGKLALLLAPWFIIISGLGLLVFTVINNKKLKLVFSIIPMAFLVWLMICSSNFFSMMGIGVIAMVVGIVLGIVSAVKELPANNMYTYR